LIAYNTSYISICYYIFLKLIIDIIKPTVAPLSGRYEKIKIIDVIGLMVNKNRRNYYRILRVQPDASPAVIRNNYRTLLQKLRLHPDLGGDHWNASQLNIAYHTLRHPHRRAAYDQELLQQYQMKALSQGHLGRGNEGTILKTIRTRPVNQRNYYRLLHIQTDSPTAIVHSSYRTLQTRKKTGIPPRLLQEAHETLGNPLKRALYDRLLRQYTHADAIDILKKTFGKNAKNQSTARQRSLTTRTEVSRQAKEKRANTANSALFQAYSPIITHYCTFCKTPHHHGMDHLEDIQCSECQSPLAPPSVALTSGPRRQISRMNQGGQVDYWLDWPDVRRTASLIDLSPTGIRLSLHNRPEIGQMIKIDARDFKAVGEITYTQLQDRQYMTGMCFTAIQFHKQRGQFLHTSI